LAIVPEGTNTGTGSVEGAGESEEPEEGPTGREEEEEQQESPEAGGPFGCCGKSVYAGIAGAVAAAGVLAGFWLRR